jgi:ATP-dependent DNA helicase PIF1
MNKLEMNELPMNELPMNKLPMNKLPMNKLPMNKLPIQILSPEQQYGLEQFKQGKNLFITGPGGTGKSVLIKHLLQHANAIETKIQVCALTGCAALLLNCNARTLHSWSGIKIAKGAKSDVIASVFRNKRAIQNWRKIKILIIDEVSMMSEKILDIIEELARLIRSNSAPFGGIQVVFTGDFYQLPPVETAGEPNTAAFCFESKQWSRIFEPENHIILQTIFRQTDPVYREILNQVRVGKIDKDKIEILQTYVGREFTADEHAGCSLPKIFPIRSKVDFVNATMFAKLKEKEYVFEFIKKVDCKLWLEKETAISQDILERCAGLSPQEIDFEIQQLIQNTQCVQVLRLKKGASVMCTINLDMDQGICNGSQGVVIEIEENILGQICPIVRFSNGIIKQMNIQYKQSDDFPAIAIGYIPLCLSWAMTIHKIQGASLKMAEIDVGGNIFEYGQTYVALSRIESLNGLYLSGFQPNKIKANEKVKAFYSTIESSQEQSKCTSQAQPKCVSQEQSKCTSQEQSKCTSQEQSKCVSQEQSKCVSQAQPKCVSQAQPIVEHTIPCEPVQLSSNTKIIKL